MVLRLLTLTWLAATTLAAQRRFDVTPLVGYRGSESIPTSPEEGQPAGKVRIAPGTTLGAAVGFRYEGLNVIEFRWTRQTTDLTYEGQEFPSARVKTSGRMDQYHGDFTREYELEEQPRIRPFIIGSVGATRISTVNSGLTRFSFGLGGGVKVFLAPRFGLRMQAQWLPIWMNPKVEGFVCGGGCIVALGGRLVHQAEVSIGPVFSF